MRNAEAMTHPPMGVIGSTEAAAILGIDKSTLTRWVIEGRVPCIGRVSAKRNGALLFDLHEIETFRQEQTERADA